MLCILYCCVRIFLVSLCLDYEIMKKSLLLSAALTALCSLCINTAANAVDVTSWSEINTNRTAESLNITDDITATGTPKVISLKAAADQIINGNGHSITGASGYNFTLNDVNVTLNNLGAYSAGTEEANTFSYRDLSDSTKYVTISKSVNSFPTYLFGRYTNDTTLNVNNSVFTDNGGRILTISAANTTLNIKDSIFYNNSSTQNVAIVSANNTCTLNVENSIFYNNHNTKDSGGAIDGGGTVSIKDSYFINNVAEKDAGGAISLGNATTLTIEGSRFEGNISNDEGGAISGYDSSTITLIKDSQFINNRNGGAYYDGGAISLSGGYIQTVDNVLFDSNWGKSNGGGLYQGMTKKQKEKPPILIKETIFKNNEAGSGGGYYTDAASNGRRQNYTYITDSEFTGNIVTAEEHYMAFDVPLGGGMISASGVPIVINNTTFTNNIADDSDSYSAGGAIYFAGPSADFLLKIIDSTFTNNSALEGGAIFVENADTAIIAETKDVIFSGNTAGADTEAYNGGGDIYFQANTYAGTLSLNAAEDKQIVFNGSIASFIDGESTSTIDINKEGVTYNTFDGETETPVTAGTAGEIQFNARVGDETQYFSAINLYGGKLSIGQNADNNANAANPDGYINDNNFYVKGDSILSTVNGLIGEFAPREFVIDDGVSLDYMFDIDLANTTSDKIANLTNNGKFNLSSFNVISDTTEKETKVKYSDTNVEGILKDDYTITTSTQTYELVAENDTTGSYVIFKAEGGGGGLPAAIINGSDQYVITDGQDENIPAWDDAVGNVITKDMDINGNGQAIYTENGIDGMVVSDGKSVQIRNVSHLSGFNVALTNGNGTLSIIDTDVTDNTGEADVKNNGGDVIIEAKTRDVKIGSGENTDSALSSDGGNVIVRGDKKVTFAGKVKGANKARMNISTDTDFGDEVSDIAIVQEQGTVDMDSLSGSVYTLNSGKLNLKKDRTFAPDKFKMNDGTVNIADEAGFMPKANIFTGGNINAVNSQTGNINFNDLTLKNAINLAVDVDMKNQKMDTISANSVRGNGMIKVNQFNILSETNNPRISIPFADANLKDRVSTDIKTLEGEIFKYNVSYDSETGNFNIVGGGGQPDGYSSSVMAASVAAQLGGYLTQLNSYDEAFRNMDMYMLMTASQRQALKSKNKYASIEDGVLYDADLMRQERPEGWLRPYATFERVPLKNGPKVSNVMYGTFVGAESKMYDLGHGWDGMLGTYVGYNGSHQSYKGNSIYQNGGTFGLVGMAYKGNFFTGLTVNAGANAGDAHTKFGSEDFAMLMTGVASKTGYNWELFNGKFIIQPSMMMSYSFVNTFDYHNAAGVKIKSDPLHAIHLQPELKFIGNLKNGWQPYASVAMIWNILDETKFKANNVSLPELSVKPYVKYGVGLRKAWGERFTGYFQTYLTNGGRNGVGLQAGFTWALGKK